MNWKFYPETRTSPAFYQSGDYRVLCRGIGRYSVAFARARREPWFAGPFATVAAAFAEAETHGREHHLSLYRKP